jgi:hypothetical protein
VLQFIRYLYRNADILGLFLSQFCQCNPDFWKVHSHGLLVGSLLQTIHTRFVNVFVEMYHNQVLSRFALNLMITPRQQVAVKWPFTDINEFKY